MANLFTPLTIQQVTFSNRMAVSPMCQYSSINGFANDWHLVHLGSRAVGGAGLVITEATAVSAEGRISPNDLGIWSDEHIPMLQRITGFIHAQGAVAGIQLSHAGRKASHHRPWNGGQYLNPAENGWKTCAPSALPYNEQSGIPLAMTQPDIDKAIGDFREAARRALTAGFKVLEIHAAHGYLIHQFLSPLSNQRTDAFGGSFENRIRFLLQVVAAVQFEWPAEYPLFVRISATDWASGGWTIDDAVQLCTVLKNHGVHLIDCSSGGLTPLQQIDAHPGYQVPFAARIKKESGIMTGAVGIIVNAGQANSIIENEEADMVLMAREMLRDPYFPLHAAYELEADVAWPNQYQRAKRVKKH